ncbi:hypothetical protein KGQ19_24385 [Catenulispora sp. NL8]|uniref:Lipoprotein n=1 Tax=Catenulispora pinistramenti TaxID=2705254 RepID=A0ABS5KVE3_9ACTN|nr:hypothetical protein [Catenulispora pinistramenti]MBS2550007.1 hypothetical protein [Catenulispora pinistramenti]
MTRRLAILIAGLFAALATLSGCAKHTPVSYAPAAYGMQVGSVYECYYVDNPAEVQTLIARGLCPVGSVPTRMPQSWLNQYFAYYDSPAYYNTYVPVSYRGNYIGTYHSYYLVHTNDIRAAAAAATWKGSNGKTVSGTQVDTAKMKFSTGSGSNSSMGGGSLRGGSSGGSVSGGSGSSGGSVSGGSVSGGSGSSGGSSGGDGEESSGGSSGGSGSHSTSGSSGGKSHSGGTSGGSLRGGRK